ncbi:MAG TPA: O-antigen ligase family protein [Candidatus Eisenbacteria bacterium]
MKPGTTRISFEEYILLALLAFVPVVFSRVTQECFEIPQSALLATGALLLTWRGLGGELAAIGRSGPGGYVRSAAWRLKSWATRDPLGVGVLLFLASAVASTIAGPNPAQSVHGAPDSTAGLVAAFSTAVVYFASRAVARGHPGVLTRYARAAGFASAVTASYALVQLAGLDPLIWGRTATFGGDVRIFGTLGHPNMLGAYLAMTAPLVIWLAIRSRNAIERVLWALVAALSVVVIAATLSRGAWIGLAAAALAWLVLGLLSRGRAGGSAPSHPSRRGQHLPAAAVVSFLVIAASVFLFARSSMGPHLTERVRQIASLNAPTTQSRLHIWRAGLRMVQDHPWLGVGLDAFGIAFSRYRTTDYWDIEWGRTPNKAHNEPIQILATQGIVGGIAALLVVIFAAIAIGRRVWREDGAARAAAVAAGASLVAFAAQNLTSFTVVALGSLAAATAGWLTSAPPSGTPERRESGRSRRAAAPAWAGALAGIPVAALFVALVVLPVRAQVYEKAALVAPDGSPERAQALERAARYAPWDSRYEHFLGSSLLVQYERDPGTSSGRELLRRAALAQRSAIATQPENGYHYANLGRVLAAQAMLRPPEASVAGVRGAFAEAVTRDSLNAQLMDKASNALIQLGQAAEARAIALKAATLYPNLAQPMGFLGYMALLEQRWKDAADTLEIAVKREWWAENAARAATLSNLSAAYLALGRNEEALRAAEEGLESNPLNPDAAANRKLALERLGRANAAAVPAGAGMPGIAGGSLP